VGMKIATGLRPEMALAPLSPFQAVYRSRFLFPPLITPLVWMYPA